jgi:UDP-arabinose 4-epimerase
MFSRNVLVTGGAGYIGSHACKALAEFGHVPVTVDNLVYGHRRAVKWGPFIEGDIADGTLLRRVLREYDIHAVMHFAAFAYVGESMQDPGKYPDSVTSGLAGCPQPADLPPKFS